MSKIAPRIGTVVKVALAVVALGFLVYFIEPARIAEAAASARPGWILAAAALLPLNLALENLEWLLLLRRVVPRATARTSFAALLCGYALGFFTPARTGEFAGRAFYLDHPDKWELSALVVVQRLADLLAALTVGLPVFCLFVTRQSLPSEPLWWGFSGYGLGATVVMGSIFVAPQAVHRLATRLLPWERAKEKIEFMREAPRSVMLRVAGLAAVRYGVYVTQFVLLLVAFAGVSALGSGYVGVSLTFYAKFLIPSITMMDLGVREAMAVFFLERLGVPAAAAFNASLLLFVVNLLLPAALGIPLLLRMRLRSDDASAVGE